MTHSDNEMVNLRSVIEMLCYMVDEDSDGVEEVMQLPTVELVRCKECKYQRLFDGETDDGEDYYYCALEDRPNRQWSINETDFCSWGERSE